MKMFPIVQVGDSDSVTLVAMFASKADAQGFLDYVASGWTDYLSSSLMLLEELPLMLDTNNIELHPSTGD